ncbi:MAG: hypothetical protein AB7N76_04410 [Planctomycetota bacterium]
MARDLRAERGPERARWAGEALCRLGGAAAVDALAEELCRFELAGAFTYRLRWYQLAVLLDQLGELE